ncbi:acyl-CoA dehydrogenase family protein [Pseudarthrobacter sp. NPDC058329]|uniref:acyl-CoA dehydrogenase family protein n=1 Tax=Pseudarthrobacter sp. NPDC058329 TaxID=3346448 RepID=UPI0036D7A397
MSYSTQSAAYRTAAWVLEHEADAATLADGRSLQLTDQTVSGVLRGVPVVDRTKTLLILAADDSIVRVSLVRPGVTVERLDALGDGQSANIDLQSVAFTVVATTSRPAAEACYLAQSTYDLAREASKAYELTREQVKTREQFGAPLVKLPAVASNLARMRVLLTQIDAAVSMLEYEGEPARDAAEIGLIYRVARATASNAGTELARLAHQLHGAKGIREDYALHQYTRRIWESRDLLVPAAENLAALGRHALGSGEDKVWAETTPARA